MEENAQKRARKLDGSKNRTVENGKGSREVSLFLLFLSLYDQTEKFYNCFLLDHDKAKRKEVLAVYVCLNVPP